MRAILIAFLSLFGLSGCCTANVNIMPQDGASSLLVATSSSENCAYEKAKEEAEKHCQLHGKHFVLVKEESQYQGMDKTAKGMISGMGAVTGTHVYTDSSEDYKVKMVFKCK